MQELGGNMKIWSSVLVGVNPNKHCRAADRLLGEITETLALCQRDHTAIKSRLTTAALITFLP